MRRYRVVADALTELRLALGPVMIVAALALREAALPYIVVCQLLSWTSDLFDGALARRAPGFPPGWAGRHDLAIDVIEAACLLAALALGGWADPGLALWYAALAGLLLILTRFARSPAMALQAPVYLWLIVIAFQFAGLVWGWLLVGWVALALAGTWPRFPREVLPGFFHGLSSMETRAKRSWEHFSERLFRPQRR